MGELVPVEQQKISYGFGTTTVEGCYTVEAFYAKAGFPIATLWFRATSSTGDEKMDGVEIYEIYVPVEVRRMGLATGCLKHLEAHVKAQGCRTVTTETATEASERWLVKNGFVNDGKQWVKHLA